MSNNRRNQAISSVQQANYPLRDVHCSLLLAYATLLTSTYLYVKYHHLLPLNLPRQPSSDLVRLTYTLKLQVFPLATLLVSYIHVLAIRLFNPLARNPLGVGEVYVEKANRILLNSVEQYGFYLVNIFLFSIQISEQYFSLVPLIVAYYTIGRIVFHIGYSIHPKHRVSGFALSFSPISIAFLYNLAKVLGILV